MLKTEISLNEIKKIFPSKTLKLDYLNNLGNKKHIRLTYGKSESSIDQAIIDSWDYSISIEILRELFFLSEKYKNGSSCREAIETAIQDWNDNEIGSFEWPFSAMNFDKRVVAINRLKISEKEKDKALAQEVIRFRRIKDINTLRNDYIEYLIFKNNNNIIPTLGHRKGVDFYIDGEPYDQKVSKSVGTEFKEQYGANYRDIAINHPELVAKSLYENQDGERFDDLPRLYIVYLDDNISNDQVETILSNIDFGTPYQIDFDYCHANVVEHHSTHCFVILLHN